MEGKEQEVTASGESLSNTQLATMIKTLSKGFEEFKYKHESRPSRVQPEMASLPQAHTISRPQAGESPKSLSSQMNSSFTIPYNCKESKKRKKEIDLNTPSTSGKSKKSKLVDPELMRRRGPPSGKIWLSVLMTFGVNLCQGKNTPNGLKDKRSQLI